MHVRKLLQEIHDVRPRFVPGEVHSPTLAASDSSHHDRQKSLSQVLSPAIARGKVWFAAIGESGKEKSDKNKLRDSQRTPAWESPFQTETPAPKMRSVGNTRAVPSPLTARLEILPPSLRLERERAVQEAARATMVSNDATDYPPNSKFNPFHCTCQRLTGYIAPDRPAPLSVRSRGSLASKMSPLPNTILRSVSTPIRTQPKEDHMPLPHARSITMARGDNTLSPASTNVAKDLASEVFESIHGRGGKHSNLFFEELANSDDRHRGSSDWYAYNNADEDHLRGPFQLDASDVASESSYGTFSSLMRGDKGRASSGVTYEGGCIGNDSFDALESYVGSEDEDDCSLLESASVISEQEACTQYQFAVQSPISNTIVAGPAPTSSQRRAAVDARSKSQVPSFVTPAMNFHRPLPLRSYESEATMFPTAGAQASSGRNRAKSVTSIIASRRHATELMRIPSQPGSSQNSDSPTSIAQEDYERDDSNTKISEQVDRYGLSVSQRSSNASTLAAFPIPSMDNPVGELPMLISRATSSPQTLHSTPSQQPVVSTSVGDAYRAITKFHMVATLQRTRNRGKQLQIIEWDKLSSFEQAWRVVNDLLLVTIYGRNDVFLSETDVAYVDCIARDLRGASGQDVPADWIRRIFEGDV